MFIEYLYSWLVMGGFLKVNRSFEPFTKDRFFKSQKINQKKSENWKFVTGQDDTR